MAQPHHALLLTAGLGTRLRPLSAVRAKPALPVAGEPLVRRIARWLSAAGVCDLVLNLHYRPATIAAVMGDGSDVGVRIRYSWEQPDVLGSAGGPRHALPLIETDPFLIVNGDTLTDLDLSELSAAHAVPGRLVTLALVPNQEPLRYGGVTLGAGDEVTGFVPRGSQAAGSFHFVGVQIAAADVFRPLPDNRELATIGGVYDRLIANRPGAIGGAVLNARFWDIGTVADYWRTTWELAGGAQDSVIGSSVKVDPTSRVTASIIWDDVEVGAGCRVDQCIVTDAVRLPPGTVCRRSVIWKDGGRLAIDPIEESTWS
jgi:mannose-1-phosphate guanylyltransferase